MSAPIWSVTCAADCCRDCASVFSAMNCTPRTSASIMRLTAFTPPPPTPTTRSCGWATSRGAGELPWESPGRGGRARLVARRGGGGHLGSAVLRRHHVVGQVGGERVAQALLRRRGAALL